MKQEVQKASTRDLRFINRNLIFKYLIASEVVAKNDIAEALKLSLPTVSQNVNELTRSGLVREVGTFDSSGGRKAAAIACEKRARFACGFYITNHFVDAVLLDLSGAVLQQNKHRIEVSCAPAYFERLRGILQGMVRHIGGKRENLLGVGVAVQAIVAHDQRSIDYNFLLSVEERFFAELPRALGADVKLYNEASSAAYAEEKKHGDIVYLSLGDTIGGAIVSEGGLVNGKNQRAGEFGHFILHHEGKACYCGTRGCADPYLSAHVLKAGGRSLAEFFAALRAGDGAAGRLWKDYIKDLALLVHNMRMCFDQDIVIGGEVGTYLPPYIEELKALLIENDLFQKSADYLKVPYYDEAAPAVGAALHYVDAFVASV